VQLLDRRFEYSEQLLVRARKQTTEQFAVTTCQEHPELLPAAIALEDEVWEPLSFLDHTPAHHNYYEELLEQFPEYHLCMVELDTGDVVATGLCVPLQIQPGRRLPDDGWDWIVNTAHEQDGRNANVIGALAISVPESYRHKGLARDMINTMRALAVMKNYKGVIAPVRPSSKCEHADVPMKDYIKWRDERGRMFDPWLRSHAAVGGQVIGVCERSMVVEKPLEFWKSWAGGPIGYGPSFTVEGALAPIKIDAAAGMGRYHEPNVWVIHHA
jgi:hypothetical protein